MNAAKIMRYPITINNETTQIGTANELAIALDVLQGQYDHETLLQLGSHLAEIIANASGLMLVMRPLVIDDQLYLIRTIGPDLVKVIRSAGALRDLLAVAPDPGVERALITTLGPGGLNQMIMTGEELAEVLEWVYGELDGLLLDLLGDEALRRLCQHAADLGAILRNIDFALQARLVEQLGWPFILDLVKDGYDLAYLLRALPAETSAVLLKQYSGPQLMRLIRNADQWTYLYDRLEPAEVELFSELLHIR